MVISRWNPMAMLEDRALVVTAIINPESHKHNIQWKQWTGGDVWIIVGENRCEEQSGFWPALYLAEGESGLNSSLKSANLWLITRQVKAPRYLSVPSAVFKRQYIILHFILPGYRCQMFFSFIELFRHNPSNEESASRWAVAKQAGFLPCRHPWSIWDNVRSCSVPETLSPRRNSPRREDGVRICEASSVFTHKYPSISSVTCCNIRTDAKTEQILLHNVAAVPKIP